jgi:hypothetical protein
VRRPTGTSRSSVLAFSDELDGWLNSAPVRANIASSIEVSAAAQSTADQDGKTIPNGHNRCPRCQGTGRIPSPITHKPQDGERFLLAVAGFPYGRDVRHSGRLY